MSQSATDILSFLVVECNVQLPYDVAINLTESDPLLQSLYKAFEHKLRRQQESNAFLASCIYNSMGGKTKPSDFLPKTKQDTEAQLKANLVVYNAMMEARKG